MKPKITRRELLTLQSALIDHADMPLEFKVVLRSNGPADILIEVKPPGKSTAPVARISTMKKRRYKLYGYDSDRTSYFDADSLEGVHAHLLITDTMNYVVDRQRRSRQSQQFLGLFD